MVELSTDSGASGLLVLRSIVSRVLWLVAIGGAVYGGIEAGRGLYLASSELAFTSSC